MPEDFVYKTIQDTDFVDEQDLKDKRPVEMKPSVCRAFLQAYENWMNKRVRDPLNQDNTNYRQMILRQVRRFEKYLARETEEYEPFPWSSTR